MCLRRAAQRECLEVRRGATPEWKVLLTKIHTSEEGPVILFKQTECKESFNGPKQHLHLQLNYDLQAFINVTFPLHCVCNVFVGATATSINSFSSFLLSVHRFHHQAATEERKSADSVHGAEGALQLLHNQNTLLYFHVRYTKHSPDRQLHLLY